MLIYHPPGRVRAGRKEKEMFKDNRYINAGVNEIYRYGKNATRTELLFVVVITIWRKRNKRILKTSKKASFTGCLFLYV